MKSALRLLQDLVALPSVNPALLPAKDRRAGEGRVADFLATLAVKAGLDCELREVFPGRSNVYVRLNCLGKARQCVVLAPHLDTVGVTNDRQFDPVIRGGRLYGRGACDTKGSVATMLTALFQLAQASKRPSATDILFVGLVDEECGQGGSRFLARTGFRADLAIVGEPTSLRIVTAHKGDLWLQLEARGRAAHGSRPELGRNAVHLMAKIVHVLETDYAAAIRRPRHALLRHATVNVGTIAGGRQPNIVPDRCVIEIDRRTLPGERDAEVKRGILRFLRRRGLPVTLVDTRGQAPAPPLETDPELPAVRQWLRSAGQRKPVGVDFFTDAGVLAAHGIPSVVFGPGDIAQAHTAEEWVAIKQLERGVILLRKLFESLP